MSSFAARILLGFAMVGTGMCSPAFAQRLDLVPFADIRQTGLMSLKGDGNANGAGNDNVTYTEVDVGFAARKNTRRIVASLAYRFSYRIAEAGRNERSTQHNGEGRIQMEVIEDALTMDAGVLATQSRVNAGGAAPQLNTLDTSNLTQTYSTYIQPTTRHHIGDLNMVGSYRIGFVTNQGKTPTTVGPPTQPFRSQHKPAGFRFGRHGYRYATVRYGRSAHNISRKTRDSSISVSGITTRSSRSSSRWPTRSH